MTQLASDHSFEGGTRTDRRSEAGSYGATVLVWMVLVVALNGLRWVGGFPSGLLAEGIEEGVARAEKQAKGETSDEQIRKAIRTQRETLSFWTALAAIDDFLIEPVFLAGRAVAVATLFTGIAALAGRTVQYERALVESARAQGFWVLGLATRLGLMIVLRRGETEIETSAAFFLPPGAYPASLWMVYRQLDLFALFGWIALARSGWKRSDTSLPGAVLVCASLGSVELALRVAAGLLMGGAIRLSLMLK